MMAVSSALPDYEEGLEDETAAAPDVFTVSHQAKVLASLSIEVKTVDLPRWKPHINLDSTEFEADESPPMVS